MCVCGVFDVVICGVHIVCVWRLCVVGVSLCVRFFVVFYVSCYVCVLCVCPCVGCAV